MERVVHASGESRESTFVPGVKRAVGKKAAMACVPIRVQGRRAVAVLREASRPNRLIYSHRLYNSSRSNKVDEQGFRCLNVNTTDATTGATVCGCRRGSRPEFVSKPGDKLASAELDAVCER